MCMENEEGMCEENEDEMCEENEDGMCEENEDGMCEKNESSRVDDLSDEDENTHDVSRPAQKISCSWPIYRIK